MMTLISSKHNNLSTFARKKGSRDRRKRKKRYLRSVQSSLTDNLFGTTTAGRVARGAGALLATGAALKYGVMPKVIKAKAKVASVSNAVRNEVNENINRAVNTSRQSARSAQEAIESVATTVDDVSRTVQRVSNGIAKVNRGVNTTIDNIKATPGRILALPSNIVRRVQSALTRSRKAVKQSTPSPAVPDPPSSTVYNGYDSLDDYVKNKRRKRFNDFSGRRFNSGNSVAKFARKKGSKDKKKRKRYLRSAQPSLTDNIFGTTTAGRVARTAGTLGAIGLTAYLNKGKINRLRNTMKVKARRKAINKDIGFDIIRSMKKKVEEINAKSGGVRIIEGDKIAIKDDIKRTVSRLRDKNNPLFQKRKANLSSSIVLAKFARKKGSKDKKKRKRSLTDNIFGTTATGRVVRVAGLAAGLGGLRYGGAALGEIAQARGMLKKAGQYAPLAKDGQRAYMRNAVMSDAPAAARERFAMDVAKLTRNKDKYVNAKLARQARRSRMDVEANNIPMQIRRNK